MADGTTLEAGKRAPAFTAPATGDAQVALKDYKGQAVVFFWYPKAMTPG